MDVNLKKIEVGDLMTKVVVCLDAGRSVLPSWWDIVSLRDVKLEVETWGHNTVICDLQNSLNYFLTKFKQCISYNDVEGFTEVKFLS